MSISGVVTFVLTGEPDNPLIEGEVELSPGTPVSFCGWLELLATLDRLARGQGDHQALASSVGTP